MRLDSLQRHDDLTAKAILATAALRHGGVPYPSVHEHRFDEEVAELIREVEGRLAISPEDRDYQHRVRRFLSDQVVAEIMGDTDLETVTAKLGAKGELPISSYIVKMDRLIAKRLGENERYIRKAIAQATDIQHIFAEGAGEHDRSRGMTIVVVPQMSGDDFLHWLLIPSIRDDNLLHVGEVYRVDPDIVDLSTAESPLEMLRAFVNHYGLEFRFDGAGPAKLFEQVRLSVAEGEISTEEPRTSEDRNMVVFGATFSTDLGDGVVIKESFALFAYLVSYTHYLRDKARLRMRR